MRIGIDCSCVAKPERTGVARYCASLLDALPAVLEPEDRVTLLYRVSRFRRRRYFERSPDPRFSLRLFHDKGIAIPRANFDVVHGPDLRLPRFPGVPAVSTVHDLSAFDVPGIARESFKRRKALALQDVARRASVVLCISEYTEAALTRRYPAIQGRTRVVPLGIAQRFTPRDESEVARVREQIGVPGRYVLFVGQISARKNLGQLISAFSAIATDRDLEDVQLVLVGPVQTGGDAVLDDIGNSAARARICLTGYVGDESLPALYSGAAAFCFTSKAEGFGLPILEAMACGCPVVAVRAGAAPGTAGDAAVVVEPDAPEALADALRGILRDADQAARLARAGRERVNAFTWHETARRTVQAYRDAVRIGVPA